MSTSPSGRECFIRDLSNPSPSSDCGHVAVIKASTGGVLIVTAGGSAVVPLHSFSPLSSSLVVQTSSTVQGFFVGIFLWHFIFLTSCKMSGSTCIDPGGVSGIVCVIGVIYQKLNNNEYYHLYWGGGGGARAR
jgi:hypothetical protein